MLFDAGQGKNFSNAFEGSDYSPSAMAVAFYSGFWAYSGWWVNTVLFARVTMADFVWSVKISNLHISFAFSCVEIVLFKLCWVSKQADFANENGNKKVVISHCEFFCVCEYGLTQKWSQLFAFQSRCLYIYFLSKVFVFSCPSYSYTCYNWPISFPGIL